MDEKPADPAHACMAGELIVSSSGIAPIDDRDGTTIRCLYGNNTRTDAPRTARQASRQLATGGYDEEVAASESH